MINKKIFFKLNSLANRSKFLDRFFIFWARDFLFIFIFFSFVVFLFKGVAGFFGLTRNEIITAVLIVIFAWIASTFLKVIHFTPRPYLYEKKKVRILLRKSPKSPAFPSGHAAILFSAGGALLCLSPILGIVVCIFGVFVVLARIITGLHWPVDVLGGAILGLLLSFLVFIFQ
jgi:undecaprenyl-diphosphatase